MKTESNKIVVILILQVMNIIFSLDSVVIKIASISWKENGLFSTKTMLLLLMAITILGVYAILWQSILSKVDLAIAYMSKGSVVFWGLIWAMLLFGERISLLNVCGTALIFIGTVLVNRNE